MAATVIDINSHQLVLAKLAGDITIDDLHAIDARLRNSPPNYDLFILETEDARIDANSKDLRDFAAQDLVLSTNSKRVIMANDEFMFGLGRMYSMTATPTEEEISVCKTLEEAAEILNIPLEKLEALSK